MRTQLVTLATATLLCALAPAASAQRRAGSIYDADHGPNGLIAEKTGVPVERLQELNPELDPQNLIVGQRVKLRE